MCAPANLTMPKSKLYGCAPFCVASVGCGWTPLSRSTRHTYGTPRSIVPPCHVAIFKHTHQKLIFTKKNSEAQRNIHKWFECLQWRRQSGHHPKWPWPGKQPFSTALSSEIYLIFFLLSYVFCVLIFCSAYYCCGGYHSSSDQYPYTLNYDLRPSSNGWPHMPVWQFLFCLVIVCHTVVWVFVRVTCLFVFPCCSPSNCIRGCKRMVCWSVLRVI